MTKFIPHTIYLLFCLLTVCWVTDIQAQQQWQGTNVSVFTDTTTAELFRGSWAGGINNPQFSAADLNNDGIDDLFIFDRSDYEVLTFINGGTPNEVDYSFDLDYTHQFPEMIEWAFLRDYNCDDIPDLFTAIIGGIKIYEGYYDQFSRLSFNLVIEQLNNVDGNIIEINTQDLPAIVDFDEDGDIDILTFNPAGGQVFHFDNIASECGIFELALVDSCWGSFYETLDKEVTLDCDCTCEGYKPPTLENLETKDNPHAGSTVLTMDLNGDGIKEMILGDLNSDNLVQLDNGGTMEDAYITDQDANFPIYDETAVFRSFLASFAVDVNNDGLDDLLVSPNNTVSMAPFNNVWYYQNVGTANNVVFELQQKDFLMDEMMDAGMFSHPSFFDYNGDGWMDLVVGNRTKTEITNGGAQVPVSSLTLYKNVGYKGATGKSAFALVTDDYLNLTEIAWKDFAPTFGDMDGDGDDDMLLGTSGPATAIGDFDGTLIYFENTAGAGQIAEFGPPQYVYQDIDVFQNSNPSLYDVNQDGLLDLIIGNRLGQVWYYKNVGNANEPIFSLTNNFWGSVDVKGASGSGHAAPQIVEEDGDRYLFVGAESGQVFQYLLNEGDLDNGAFELITKTYKDIQTGRYLDPAFEDLTDDGIPEMITGSRRGGLLLFYTQNVPTAMEEVSSIVEIFQVSPNPANQYLEIKFLENINEKTQVKIFNMEGKMIKNHQIINHIPYLKLDCSQWTSGLYFINIEVNDQKWSKKVTIKH